MTVRRREFRNGKATVRETYAATVFKNEKCGIGGCTDHVVMRATVFWPLDELMKRDGQFALVARMSPKAITDNLVQMNGGDGKPVNYIRHRVVYACAKHDKELEKACAGRDIPSWCIVEFQRGPNEAPIMRGWDAELANAKGLYATPPKTSEDHGSFRVNDYRSSAQPETAPETPTPAEEPFRDARFDITHRFNEGFDPDRVAEVFAEDLQAVRTAQPK